MVAFDPVSEGFRKAPGTPRNWIGWGRLRLPRLQLDHLAIHCEPAVPVMVNRLRTLLGRISPGFEHFKHEHVELVDEAGTRTNSLKVYFPNAVSRQKPLVGWHLLRCSSSRKGFLTAKPPMQFGGS